MKNSLDNLFELSSCARRLVVELANDPIDPAARPHLIQRCLPLAATILAAQGEEALWQVAEKLRPDYGQAVGLLPLTLMLAGALPRPCPGREQTHRLHPVLLPVSIHLPATLAQGETGAPPARLWDTPELRAMTLQGERRALVDPHLYTAPYLWNAVTAQGWFAYTNQLLGLGQKETPFVPLGAGEWIPGLERERLDRSAAFEDKYLISAFIEAPLGSYPYSVAPIALADLLARPLQRLRPGATLEVLREKVMLGSWAKELALEMTLQEALEPMLQGVRRMIQATPSGQAWIGRTAHKSLLCIEMRHPETGAGVAEFHLAFSTLNCPAAEVEATARRVLQRMGIPLEGGHGG